MSFKEKKTTYFEEAGKENTDNLLTLTKNYAEKENIENIVVASTTGEAAIYYPPGQ